MSVEFQPTVLTFIIHGDHDEIALFESASQFGLEMGRQGIKSGFLLVRNGRYIHDLRLRLWNYIRLNRADARRRKQVS